MTHGFHVAGAALLFDMDGTLVDSTAVVEQIWAEFADRYEADLQEVLRYAHGRLTIDTVRRFLPAGVDAHAAATDLDADELERLDGIVEVPGAADLLRALQGARWQWSPRPPGNWLAAGWPRQAFRPRR